MGLGDQNLGEMRPLIQLYALDEGVRCVFNVFQVRRYSHIYIYICTSPNMYIYIYVCFTLVLHLR